MIKIKSDRNFNKLVKLDWDTEYFGVACGKIDLTEELTNNEWLELNNETRNYDFVVIKNINSNYKNSKVLGESSNSFLVDINIQFKKEVSVNRKKQNVTLLEKDNKIRKEIISLADFNHSRFIEDKRLYELGGSSVYKEWVKNSFDDSRKEIIIRKNDSGELLGFALISKKDANLIIELIVVNKNLQSAGIGTRIFNDIEYYAAKNNQKNIIVGTQVTNLSAMNFYNKMGLKQFEVHQIFHLWNK